MKNVIELTIKIRYPEGPIVNGMSLFERIETSLKESIHWPDIELERPKFRRLE